MRASEGTSRSRCSLTVVNRSARAWEIWRCHDLPPYTVLMVERCDLTPPGVYAETLEDLFKSIPSEGMLMVRWPVVPLTHAPREGLCILMVWAP